MRLPKRSLLSMRYAIYYTPANDSPLWQQGCRWLGREATTGVFLPQPRIAQIDPDRLAELTRIPRHYGFHATVVPPFHLQDGTSEAQLVVALTDFTTRQHAFLLPSLEITQLDSFFCLRPKRFCHAMHGLAAQCLRELDRFRAPLSASEMARRKAGQLNGQQKRNLELWGYPYVLDQYRFHFTLTARLAETKEKERIRQALGETFDPHLQEPFTCDALCLFVEPEPGQPLRCTQRFPFLGSSAKQCRSLAHDQHHPVQDLYSRYQCHFA